MKPVNFYAGSRLDRASERRKDTEWLRERLADPNSRFVPMWRQRHLTRDTESGPRALLLERERVAKLLATGAESALLGIEDGIAHFAIDLGTLDDPLDTLRLDAAGVRFQELLHVGGLLDAGEAAMLAQARGLLNWHLRHGFCGVCGAPTVSADAGHVRKCSDPTCGAVHFPRTDPVVIMLVTSGDECLLGRQSSWPRGMFSALAGFVEPGESLEEAVAREVKEESGIVVDDVTYHSSQPWPFPSSLMLGFRARARTRDIVVDRAELEQAHWFSRALLTSADAPGMPGPWAIARRLIEEWLSEG